MQDTAARHDGHVFALRNEDLVLLCRAADRTPIASAADGAAEALRGSVAHPHALPDIMGRLLQADIPNGAALVSVWRLETQGDQLMAYAAGCLTSQDDALQPEDNASGQTEMVDAIGSLVGTAAISDLMQRQTAVLLPGASDPAGPTPRPLFREVTFSVAALEARIAATCNAGADPFLFRHLAARMDQRMLEVLCEQIGSGGPLDVALPSSRPNGPLATETAAAPPMLHLNLTLPGMLSPAFHRFVAACATAGAALGVEVSLIEAVADPQRFARARDFAQETGLILVLDGVSHLSMLIARPARLRPDLLKLDWSPRLIDLPAHEQASIAEALAEIDPARVVLHRAETEAALRWGLSQGIRRFQGRHVDAMLGASRIVGCAQAPRCTLRQCIERAGATGAAGRAGCQNMALLDQGMPTAPPIGGPTPPSASPLDDTFTLPRAFEPARAPDFHR